MASYRDDAKYINERRTRKTHIDPTLEKVGWRWEYVKEEVNSVRSDFKNSNLIYFDDDPQKGRDSLIISY